MNNTPVFHTHPLEQVREGMAVYDAIGQLVGSVTSVHMGDPNAVEGPREDQSADISCVMVAPAMGGGATAVGAAAVGDRRSSSGLLDSPDVRQRRLDRTGYIVVDGPTLKGEDRFIGGDRIAYVSGEAVRLRPSPAQSTAPPAPTPTSPRPRPMSFQSSMAEPQTSQRGWPQWLTPVAAATISAAAAAGIGGFVYRQRQDEAKRRRRLQQGGAAAGGALLVAILGALLRSRSASATTSVDYLADARPRLTRPLVYGLAGLGSGLLLSRLFRGKQQLMYIGTPGIESASGRDRVRSGEMPREMGVEYPGR